MLIVEIDNFGNQIATLLQYFKQEADLQKTGAVIPMDALSDFMVQQGITINPDVIKTIITTDPTVKNLVKSFDGEKITIDTIVEPKDDGSEIKGSDEVSKMAKRALNKRS